MLDTEFHKTMLLNSIFFVCVCTCVQSPMCTKYNTVIHQRVGDREWPTLGLRIRVNFSAHKNLHYLPTEKCTFTLLVRKHICVQNIYQMPYFSSEPKSPGWVEGTSITSRKKVKGLLLQSEWLPRPPCQLPGGMIQHQLWKLPWEGVGSHESLLGFCTSRYRSPWNVM